MTTKVHFGYMSAGNSSDTYEERRYVVGYVSVLGTYIVLCCLGVMNASRIGSIWYHLVDRVVSNDRFKA